MKKLTYRPHQQRNGFLLDTPSPRETPKSAFLRKLERAQERSRAQLLERELEDAKATNVVQLRPLSKINPNGSAPGNAG